MQGYFQAASFSIPQDSEPVELGDTTHIDYIIMSRRSRDRAGLRYQRRGIDDEAHVANFVETETITRVDVCKTQNFIDELTQAYFFFSEIKLLMSSATFRLGGPVGQRCFCCASTFIVHSTVVLDADGSWPKAPTSIIPRNDARTKHEGIYSSFQTDVANLWSSCKYFDSGNHI